MGVTRLETAKNSVDARCMRQLVAVRPRPPHTRSACHTAIPSHMCFSPRAPAHTQCLLTATPNDMCLSPAPTPEQTRVIAGLAHRHAQQRDGSIAHTGTSGTTPHGKNESIARAGIKSKPNTRHHQIRLWLHVRPVQRTGCATRRHGPRRVRSRGLFGRKVGGGDVAWSVRDGVT